jgi:hypothetical protein
MDEEYNGWPHGRRYQARLGLGLRLKLKNLDRAVNLEMSISDRLAKATYATLHRSGFQVWCGGKEKHTLELVPHMLI